MEKETKTTQPELKVEEPKTPIWKKVPWKKVGTGLAVIGTTFLAGFLGAKYGSENAIDGSHIAVHFKNDSDDPVVIYPDEETSQGNNE